jgi:cytochrome c oxidase cbb3-type subunit 4
MSPILGHAIGVIIVLMMLVFGGILIWAWLPYHKEAFDALARLPMRDGGILDQTLADKQR